MVQRYINGEFVSVFIHRSIKTRIETISLLHNADEEAKFLYIDPLKQGLKRCSKPTPRWKGYCFYT